MVWDAPRATRPVKSEAVAASCEFYVQGEPGQEGRCPADAGSLLRLRLAPLHPGSGICEPKGWAPLLVCTTERQIVLSAWRF